MPIEYNKSTHFIISLNDITQRKADEYNFAQNAKLASIGQMAAGIAHEINNPITIISGYARSVEKYLTTENAPEKFLTQCKNIIDAAKRVARIVASVKQLSHKPSKDSYINDSLSEIIDKSKYFLLKKLKTRVLNLNSYKVTAMITYFVTHLRLAR